ncbi:hypothetical protein [Dongia sp.]|uniref:hypothetical protein n=1 Tax=Dongia sp. TaxID=1977262 RepID=UPI00375074F0
MSRSLPSRILAAISIVAVFLFFAPQSRAAGIAFDQATNVQISSSGVTSLTYSATVAASNETLIVAVHNVSGDTVTGVTYNGAAMTLVTKAEGFASGQYMYLYYLTNPSTGTNNVVVSRSNTTSVIVSQAAAYSGMSLTGQPDSFNSGNSLSPVASLTVNTTVVLSGSWIVAWCEYDNNPTCASSQLTFRGANNNGFSMGDTNAGVSSGSNSITLNNQGGGDQRAGMLVASFASDATAAPSIGDWFSFWW